MKILICSDGSEQANQAIQFGGMIAGACQAETTLLGITEKPSEEDTVFEALRGGLQILKQVQVNAEMISKAGEPIEEIVRRTQETKYDLVVIGAARKGTRGPFLMSAKAYKIIKAVEVIETYRNHQKIAIRRRNLSNFAKIKLGPCPVILRSIK